MAITVLDVVIAKVGSKDVYTMGDFEEAGVPFFSGCQRCESQLAGYNAYPSKTGFIRCTDCLGDLGFSTVSEFKHWENTPGTLVGEEDDD